MAALTICSDFGAPQNKVWHCLHCFPIYFPWSDGTGCQSLKNQAAPPYGHSCRSSCQCQEIRDGPSNGRQLSLLKGESRQKTQVGPSFFSKKVTRNGHKNTGGRVSPHQWFSASWSPEPQHQELVRNAGSQARPRPAGLETLQAGPAPSSLTKALWFCCLPNLGTTSQGSEGESVKVAPDELVERAE